METTSIEALHLQKWERKAFRESVRKNLFGDFVGTDEGAIVQTKRGLVGGGKTLTVGLVNTLKGKGTGTGTLEGNEEGINQQEHTAYPVWRRHATKLAKSEEAKSAIDLAEAQRFTLVDWRTDDFRDRMIDATFAIGHSSSYVDEKAGIGQQIAFYDARATETLRDTWVTNNANRLLFGSTASNLVTGDFSASLANVDSTNDKFGYQTVVAARKLARGRDREVGRKQVRPVRADDGHDYMVMVVSPDQYSQAWEDSVIQDFHKQALPRAKDNPFFKAGDIMVQNIMIREIPELAEPAETYLASRGASSANLTAGALYGAQSFCYAIAQSFRTTRSDKTDYGFYRGIGTESYDAIEKMFFDGEQYGVVNFFTAKD